MIALSNFSCLCKQPKKMLFGAGFVLLFVMTLACAEVIPAQKRLIHVPLHKISNNNNHKTNRAPSPPPITPAPVMQDPAPPPSTDDAAAIQPCDDVLKVGEIVLSPLAKANTTLVRVKRPAQFRADEMLAYSVLQQPVKLTDEEQHQIPAVFAFFNNTNELRVAYDKLSGVVDLTQQYDVPLTLTVKVQGEQQACSRAYPFRYYDNYLAVEPDWEVNPVLASSYTFDIDCPEPQQLVGVIGDEFRNKIYDIDYFLEEDITSNQNVKKPSSQYLVLNQKTGQIHTKKLAPKNSTFSWKISASALRARKIYSFVTINFGTCVGRTAAARAERFKIQFKSRCAKQGLVLGQLPRQVGEINVASYIMFPNVRDFSVTADGKIRVLAPELDPRVYQNVQVSAQTADGNTYVFHANITNEPCVELPPNAQLLPTLGATEVNCPTLSATIIQLSRLKKFQEALSNHSINSGAAVIISTNMPSTVSVQPDLSLVWTRKPTSTLDDGPPLLILISARVNSASEVPLGFVNVTVRQQVPECSQYTRRAGQHNFLVQCPSEGAAVAFIDPTTLPLKLNVTPATDNTTDIERLSATSATPPLPLTLHYSLCCSEYYDIGTLSGVVSVAKVPPPELTSMLTVQVVAPASEQLPDGFVFASTLYFFTDPDTSGKCDQPPPTSSDAEIGGPPGLTLGYDANVTQALDCSQFGDTKQTTQDGGEAVLPLGVLNYFDGYFTPEQFVVQLTAKHNRSGIFGVQEPISWFLSADDNNDESSKSHGYRIDRLSGNIYTTRNSDVAPTVTAVARALNWRECRVTVKPFVNLEKNRARGILNRQPPHLTTGDQWNYKTRSMRCSSSSSRRRSDGVVSMVEIGAGAYIMPVTAYDADIGAAGDIFYSLCNDDGDFQCKELTTIVPDCDLYRSFDVRSPVCMNNNRIFPSTDDERRGATPVQLLINPKSGFLFADDAARWPAASTTLDTSTLLRVRVKVSNDASILDIGSSSSSSTTSKLSSSGGGGGLFGVPAQSGYIGIVSVQFVCSNAKQY